MPEIKAELEGCRLLCEPCHVIKTIEVDRGHRVRAPRLLAHKAAIARRRPQ